MLISLVKHEDVDFTRMCDLRDTTKISFRWMPAVAGHGKVSPGSVVAKSL